MVLILNVCTDDGSPNSKALQFFSRLYMQFNTPTSPLIFASAHTLCMAHQLSLSSRSQFAALGGATQGDSKQFMGRLLGMCHIFAAASYFLRIWSSTMRILDGVRMVTPEHARARSIQLASEGTRSHHAAMLRFLAQAVLQRHKLSDSVVAAIQTITAFLNTDHWGTADMDRPTHICYPGCQCGGRVAHTLARRSEPTVGNE